MEALNTVGRRKASVARIHVTKGSGNISINGKELKDYFTITHISNKVVEPMSMVAEANEYDFKINVKGGGFKGQAEAIRMGIARAFVKINEDNRKPLKEKKFLRRDARVVERKKFGKPKARKSFQFSKR